MCWSARRRCWTGGPLARRIHVRRSACPGGLLRSPPSIRGWRWRRATKLSISPPPACQPRLASRWASYRQCGCGWARSRLLLTSHRLLYGLAADWVSVAKEPEMRAALQAQGPLVKSITTNNAVRVTDLALRVVGGAGLQRTMRLEQLFRDARAGLINAPLDDIAWQNAGKAAVDQAAREEK